MQPRSGETSSRVHIPQNANSSAIETISLLSVERFWSRTFSITPNRQPIMRTRMFIPIGFSTLPALKCPEAFARATDIAALYATSPTTSSSATTWSRVSTKSPFAWVWRIVMTVEAGAVAEASAPSTSEKLISSPRIKNDTMKTMTDARHASSTVITTTFAPFFLSVEKRKNSPVLNAINARAMSFKKSMPSTIFSGTRWSTYGPSRTPDSMYAVTFGSRSRFVMRVIAKPVISISAIEIMMLATGDVMLNAL